MYLWGGGVVEKAAGSVGSTFNRSDFLFLYAHNVWIISPLLYTGALEDNSRVENRAKGGTSPCLRSARVYGCLLPAHTGGVKRWTILRMMAGVPYGSLKHSPSA